VPSMHHTCVSVCIHNIPLSSRSARAIDAPVLGREQKAAGTNEFMKSTLFIVLLYVVNLLGH
jgi:hypothetical protein